MPDRNDINQVDIDAYIAQVEASAVLGRSKRRIRLLTHLITSEVLGQGDRLKAYSIGLDIFGKPSEFDPATDSVVRVEMGRLRTALTVFEASTFATTDIVVDIPVGTYRPTIALRHLSGEHGAADAPPRPAPKRTAGKRAWVIALGVVAILCVGLGIRNFALPRAASATIGVQISASDPSDATMNELKTALAEDLSRSRSFSILASSAQQQRHGDARFDIELSVSKIDDNYKATTALVDLDNQRLIWSKTLKAESLSDLRTSFENTVARELRVRLFGASKEFLEKLDPDDLSPEALFVLATWVPGVAESAVDWEQSRIELAKRALTQAPDFGAAHSVVADKLAYLANVYAPADTAENHAAALYHAKRAMDLSPLDPDVVFNVAQSYWHSGLIAESQATMSRVVELDPNHDLAQFLRMVIPYTCAAAPRQIVDQAIAFDATLSSDNPIRWLTLTWIGWLHINREDWASALLAEDAAARIFQVPYSFMRRALVLNKLSRPQDAIDVIARQQQNWEKFDPAHYINETAVRLCRENPEPEAILSHYQDLLRTLKDSTSR